MKELLFKKSDHILILAPHPDDESIGCGGVLSQHSSQTDVILLTDGRYGGTEDPLKIKKIRALEFQKVMDYAKVHSFFRLEVPDRNLKNSFSEFKKIDFSPYTHIFIPHKNESQTDHKRVFPFLLKCKIKKETLICEYEVWTPMQKPNYFLKIQSYNLKKIFISYYKSQLKYNDYINAAEGLNRYRGLLAHTKYAECFTVRTFAELKLKHCFWNKLWGCYPKMNGQKAYSFMGFHLNIGKKKNDVINF